jgi:hypothetical protein
MPWACALCLTPRIPGPLRLFGATLMLLAAAPGLIVLALFMVILGIPLSPWLGSLSASVQRTVPAAGSTEAFAWSFAVITVGMAAGNAISGVVIQSANTGAVIARARTTRRPASNTRHCCPKARPLALNSRVGGSGSRQPERSGV